MHAVPLRSEPVCSAVNAVTAVCTVHQKPASKAGEAGHDAYARSAWAPLCHAWIRPIVGTVQGT